MILNKTVIRHKVAEFEFDLVCMPEAPCDVILDALKYFKGTIQDIIDEAKKQQAEAEKEKSQESEECCVTSDCCPNEEICQ